MPVSNELVRSRATREAGTWNRKAGFDYCGDAITEPLQALVTWSTDSDLRAHHFLYVHKGDCDKERNDKSWELSHTLGLDGHAWWMSFLTNGPVRHGEPKAGVVDMDEFVDAFRRAQVPGYEEARPYFRSAEVQERYADAPEFGPYEPWALANIAEIGRKADV